MNPHEQNVLELIGTFRQALGPWPTSRRARHVLRSLATGQTEVDEALRQCAEVVYTLTICKPLLISGHPRGQIPACATN